MSVLDRTKSEDYAYPGVQGLGLRVTGFRALNPKPLNRA